jgi:aminoacyl tRNA synthase complex-interacting multifunctional protein 1
VDHRGTDVPDPPIDSLDELIARNSESKANGGTMDIETSVDTTAAAVESPSDTVDISKLDIRVGIITTAWEHEDAEKLFCEEIDIGEEQGPRRIASGLRAYYTVDDLPGRRVLVVSNLKARKLAGFESYGMVLCASSTDGKVQFIEPPDDAVVGDRIVVQGYDGAPATENQIIKKKMLDVIFPDLKTNNEGIPSYNGIPLSTKSGPCKPSLPNSMVS